MIGVLDFGLPETAKWPPEDPLLILKGPEKTVKNQLQLKKEKFWAPKVDPRGHEKSLEKKNEKMTKENLFSMEREAR